MTDIDELIKYIKNIIFSEFSDDDVEDFFQKLEILYKKLSKENFWYLIDKRFDE